MSVYNLTQTVKRGETVEWDFAVTNDDGSAASLGGLEEVTFSWSRYRDGPALQTRAYTDGEVEVSGNVVTVFLFPEDTGSFLRGERYFYDITVTIDGLDTKVATGDFVVEGSVGVALP